MVLRCASCRAVNYHTCFEWYKADLKIIDFGLSRFEDGSEAMTTRVGTPYYIAPEGPSKHKHSNLVKATRATTAIKKTEVFKLAAALQMECKRSVLLCRQAPKLATGIVGYWNWLPFCVLRCRCTPLHNSLRGCFP